jgi:hypothetical protein
LELIAVAAFALAEVVAVDAKRAVRTGGWDPSAHSDHSQ